MKSLLVFLILACALRAATASVDIGQTFTISVTNKGTPPFTYQWYKDGAPIQGATKSTYSASNVSAVDAGNYTVKIVNKAGETLSDTAAITIIVKPPSEGITAVATQSAL